MFRNQVKKFSVTAQVFWPGFADFKFALLAAYRRARRRPHEKALVAMKFIQVSDTGLLLDIGGHLGQSVASMRFFSKTAPIISFEPNPFLAAKLRKRFRHDSAVKVQTLAIGGTEGDFVLYIPVYKCCAIPDLGTLNRSLAETWLSSRIYGYDASQLMVLELPCKCTRLDALKLEPELIHIDCVCDASAVIQGGIETISEWKPAFVLEAALLSEACVQLLQRLGYRRFRYREKEFSEVGPTERCDLLLTEQQLRRAGNHFIST
jgi:FkbM family methyltransferase